MITGAHSIIYSNDPEADKKFFKNILKFSHVDIGHGWLIFGLPPSEVAIHPSSGDEYHEFYLMCDDIKLLTKEMTKHKVKYSVIEDQRWGLLTYITLPGGSKLGVYEPKHARPANPKKVVKAKVKTPVKKKSVTKK